MGEGVGLDITEPISSTIPQREGGSRMNPLAIILTLGALGISQLHVIYSLFVKLVSQWALSLPWLFSIRALDNRMTQLLLTRIGDNDSGHGSLEPVSSTTYHKEREVDG